ncbi:unnamed protein product [Acanthoscelides obtectus]|nr:unnamed protein product [Acanthoscelides obtectus]CAK1677278.1 hypothetical protein AOBTE_LOCUS31222 [Acanthoscelides obtectus]
MKITVIFLGLLLPLCLTIRVKEFVYIEDTLGGGLDAEESQEQFFNTYFANDGDTFNWDDIPSKDLSGNSVDIDIPAGIFAKYPIPEEAHLISIGAEGVGITAQLNEFADKLIHNFGHLLAKKGFDPAQLPNQTYHFIWTFNLTEGWLQDLATIARLDDVIASYKSQTRTLNIALPLQFDTLVFSYKYDRHVALHHKGTVQGKINKVKIDCQLSYNYATYKVHLDKFDIRDSG